MAETHPRDDVQLLAARSDEAEVPVRVVTLDHPAYMCLLCGSSWPYQAVRNTGRCPTCGSGLLRDGDCP